MKEPTKLEFQDLDRFVRQGGGASFDEAFGKVLGSVAILLAFALLLAAEATLPDQLRFSVFEASYTSP